MALSRFVRAACRRDATASSAAAARCGDAPSRSPRSRRSRARVPSACRGPVLNILEFQLKSRFCRSTTWTRRVHALQVDAPVHEIARIVLHAHLAQRREQRVRSSRSSTESIVTPVRKPPLIRPRCTFPFAPASCVSRSPPQPLAAVVRLRDEQAGAQHDRPEQDEHAQADDRDEATSGHPGDARLRNRDRSRR